MSEKPILDLERASQMSNAELAAKLFDGQHRIVGNISQWRAANPERYSAIRQLAKDTNRVGQTVHDKLQAVREKWDSEKNKTMTARQVHALAEFSSPEVVKAVTAAQALDWKTTDPARYVQYRIAGATLGVFPQSILDKLNPPDEPGDDGTLHEIPTTVAERLNLDPTLRLTRVGLDRALHAFADSVAKEKAAQEAAKQA